MYVVGVYCMEHLRLSNEHWDDDLRYLVMLNIVRDDINDCFGMLRVLWSVKFLSVELLRKEGEPLQLLVFCRVRAAEQL